MLELRPNCEWCDVDLPPASTAAMICTYECTFCAGCVTDVLAGVCPNCGGGFASRPVRPVGEYRPGLSISARRPSVQRVHSLYTLEEVTELAASLSGTPPEDR